MSSFNLVYAYLDLSYNLTAPLLLFFSLVCKDESCSGDNACREATIDYVVGTSCSDYSCWRAKIGSVDSSCKDDRSCSEAQLNGVDLVNSCNKSKACYKTKGKEEIFDLIGCCNESIKQCYQEEGADIYAAGGCVSYMCTVLLLLLIVSLFVKWLTLLSFTC